VVLVAAVVAQQHGWAVVLGDREVQVAVVVDVRVGGAARDARPAEIAAELRRDVLEAAVAEVPEQVRRLGVGDLRLHAVDVVGHVPADGEQVEPAVEVEVEEERREGQRQQRGLAERRRRRVVHEEPVALVVVEREHLVREVADHDARAPGAVEVRGIHAHPGARHAGLGERHARRHADVLEAPVAEVLVELVRLRVVGHEHVHPAVAVEVQLREPERLRARVLQAGLLRDVLEGSVGPALVQREARTLVRLGCAVRLGLAVERAVEVGGGDHVT
jgi:hypothetical protein